MKRLSALLLCLIFTFVTTFGGAFGVVAEGDKINLRYESRRVNDTKTTVGFLVEMPKNSTAVEGVQMSVAYNAELFSVSNITSAYSVISNIIKTTDPEDSEKQIETGVFNLTFDSNGGNGITADTTLFSFDVTYDGSLPTGNYDFKTTVNYLFDADLSELDYTVNNSVYIDAAAVDEKLTVKPSEIELSIGETFDLGTKFTPENYNYKSVGWSSNSSSVATVSADGRVQAVGYGTAQITAKADTGLSGYCSVTVTDRIPVAVGIYKNPQKTTYKISETFDDEGLCLWVEYEDGEREYKNGGWIILNGGPLSGLDHSVTVNYRGVQTEVEIQVSADIEEQFSKIEIGNYPRTDYVFSIDNSENFNLSYAESLIKNLSFDMSGLTVDVTRKDGTKVEDYTDFNSGLLSVNYKKPKIGENEISVTFDGKTICFDVFVDAVIMDVTNVPQKAVALKENSKATPDFSNFSAQISSVYQSEVLKDGETVTVAGDDFSYSYADLTEGVNSVTATYNYLGTEFKKTFNLKAYYPKKIEIASVPDRTRFALDETPDFSGLSVVAVDKNDNKFALDRTDYTLDYGAFSVGKNTVNVLFSGLTTSFTVTVLPVSSVSVSASMTGGLSCEKYELTIKLSSQKGEKISFEKLGLSVFYDSDKIGFVDNSVVCGTSDLKTAAVQKSNDGMIKISLSDKSVTLDSGSVLIKCKFSSVGNTQNITSSVRVTVNELCFNDKTGGTIDYPISKNSDTVEFSIGSHKSTAVVTKAGLTKDGKIQTVCSECKKVLSSTAIPRVSSVKLSVSKSVYNGKTVTPKVTVKDSKGKTLSSSCYSVSYSSGRKNVGKYKVTVTLKGNYSGKKTLSFSIVPKGTNLSSVKSSKTKTATVKWKKQKTQTSGYQIRYSTKSNYKTVKYITVSKNSTVSKTIAKLAKKKTYYFSIRTYKTVGKTKFYSSWSGSKKVKIK